MPALNPNVLRFVAELNRPLVVFDLETTTHIRSSESFGVTEIFLTRIEPTGEVSQYSHLVNPENPISADASRITGITQEMVAAEPNFGALLPEFGGYLGDAVLCGFNIRGFDIPALLQECDRYQLTGPDAIDLIDLREVWSASGITENGKGTLTAVAEYFGVEKGQAHRAEGDVITCLNLLPEMIYAFGRQGMMGQFKEFFTAKQQAEQKAASGAPRNFRDVPAAEREARDQIVDSIVLLEAQSGEQLTVKGIVAKHGKAKTNDFEVSQSLQRLVDTGKVQPSQVWDQAAQDFLAANLATIVATVPGGIAGKKKPMIEKAKEMQAPASLDYVQLSVGLMQLKQQQAAQPQEPTQSRAPGMRM